VQFIYHAGSPGIQKRASHHGTADGKPFRLFLSDISVKVTGSDSWINAE